MKGRLTTLRRSAVAVGLSLSMVVAAGASAKAASPVVTLNNYTASAVSQSLHVALQLPDAISSALQTLGGTLNGVVPGLGSALGNIDERISFASATGQFTNTPKTILGKSVGQTFYGTLDGLISTVLQVPQSALAPLQAVTNNVNTTIPTKVQTIKSLVLPSAALPVINIGIGKQAAGTATKVTSAVSNSSAELLGIDVSLAPIVQAAGLTSTLQQLQTTVNGIVGQINSTLGSVLNQAGLGSALGTVTVPTLPDLSKVSILHVGIMDAVSGTSVQNLAQTLANGATEIRSAHATNQLANVDVLGGLVHLDAITETADASLDNRAGSATANAVTKILGLKVGNNALDLTTDSIHVAGQTIAMPDALKSLLNNLVVNVAGVDIEALHNVKEATPGHAFAQANSLRISVAPTLGGSPLFALTLEGPQSQARVDLGTTAVKGEQIFAKTGLNDTMYVLYGVLFLAVAVLVRRFALSNR
jgi:hypothetical protein